MATNERPNQGGTGNERREQGSTRNQGRKDQSQPDNRKTPPGNPKGNER